MKIKCRLLLILCVLFISSGIYAQSYSWTVSQGASVTVGTGIELVYANTQTRDLLSELLWEIPGTISSETSFTWTAPNQTSVSGSISVAVTSPKGEMTDTDYFPPGTDYSQYEYPFKYWSRSDAFVVSAVSADLRFTKQPGRTWRYHSGIWYRYWEWTDKAWEYIYFDTRSGSGYEKGSFEGADAIDYLQHFFIPYVGISFVLGDELTQFEQGLYASFLSFAYANDLHRLRNPPVLFEDLAQGGLYLSFESDIKRKITNRTSFELFMNAAWIPAARADTKQTEQGGEPLFFPSQAGIGLRELTFGAAFSIHR